MIHKKNNYIWLKILFVVLYLYFFVIVFNAGYNKGINSETYILVENVRSRFDCSDWIGMFCCDNESEFYLSNVLTEQCLSDYDLAVEMCKI